MKHTAACDDFVAYVLCQPFPALSSRMYQPSWWPRQCLFPWQSEDTGSSARGQCTVLLYKRLYVSQMVTTWFQNGARWWSSAPGVRNSMSDS